MTTDGTYTAVMDRFEDDLAVLLLEDDGETVGVSKWPAYRDHVQEMMSLGIVDPDVSDPGTEVTVVWGEEDSPKESVEDHEEVEITATVAEVPYREDRRKTADYATP